MIPPLEREENLTRVLTKINAGAKEMCVTPPPACCIRRHTTTQLLHAPPPTPVA